MTTFTDKEIIVKLFLRKKSPIAYVWLGWKQAFEFWLRVWDIELTLVPNLQIKPRKYSPEKYVWYIENRHGGTVTTTSLYAKAGFQKVL